MCTLLQTTTENLATALEEAPATPLQHIDILDDAERSQLLSGWNGTAHYVPESTLAELFQAQVARTPQAIAVTFEDEQLSYAEVDVRASQLARLLIGRGVGPETLVAVLMDRSADLVIALLAILKAGGAYVPVDPSYPTTASPTSSPTPNPPAPSPPKPSGQAPPGR